MGVQTCRSVKYLTFYSLILFAFFFVPSAHSMSWNDEEWNRSKCPKDVSGAWIAQSHSPSAGHRMVIHPEKVLFSFKNGKTREFRYQSKPVLTKNQKFIEFQISHVAKGGLHPRLYRIRPHRVRSFENQAKDEVDQPQCLIKVFRYASEKDVEREKYINWDIYLGAK